MPAPFLAVFYWLHLLATVSWAVGLATLTLAAWPGLGHTSDERATDSAGAFDGLERRFRPFANVSLLVLLITGMIQIGGDSHYESLLQIANAWSLGMLFKHVTVGGVILVSFVLRWGVGPALDRAKLLDRTGQGAEAATSQVRRRLRCLAALNLILGILVLAITAAVTAL